MAFGFRPCVCLNSIVANSKRQTEPSKDRCADGLLDMLLDGLLLTGSSEESITSVCDSGVDIDQMLV